jgi:hypothetical protein
MPRHDKVADRALDAVLLLAKPYLRLHLFLYTRAMSSAAFPVDDRERMVLGPDPHRVLFVGDIGVAGYGVLLPGMAMPAQAAARLAGLTSRGCISTTVSAFDMTAEKALTGVRDKARRLDVAVLALGLPDALLMTSPDSWQRQLTDVIDSVRDQAGAECTIVLAGIAPMHHFRAVPPVARTLLRWQVRRLNDASRNMQHLETGVIWVPFPVLRQDRDRTARAFSFRAMHAEWAIALTPYLTP